MQLRGSSVVSLYRLVFLEYQLMQRRGSFAARLYYLTLEYNTSVKAKMQMYYDGTNKDKGNNYECQDICDQVKHIIPCLSLFVS